MFPIATVSEVGSEKIDPITETDQRAFVIYNPDEQTQRLVFDIRTEEFAGDFVWFIPIPQVPADAETFLAEAVTEVGPEGFAVLSEWAEPQISFDLFAVSDPPAPRSGFFFACAPLAGPPGVAMVRLADSQQLEDSGTVWAGRSTGSYQVSVYAGGDYDEFVTVVADTIGESTSAAVQAQLPHCRSILPPRHRFLPSPSLARDSLTAWT